MTKRIKTPSVEWVYRGEHITSITQMPEGAIGFVYQIKYVDGMYYLGKKNLYKTNTVKALKNGKTREGTIERVLRNTGKGFRQVYDRVQSESDWRTYQGSHKECKIRLIKEKHILEYAFNKKQLTYLEAEYLFKHNVLRSKYYLNDNILGTFFRSDFNG